MAITTNSILVGARGAIGKQLIIKQYKDKTVLSAMPDFSHRKLSPKQIANNERMIDANDYAQDILADEQLRNEAQIRLNVQRNKLYYALIKEYYRQEKEKGQTGAAS